jgi:hypothetical protein
VYPASCPGGTVAKTVREWNFHPVSRLRMRRAIPPLSIHVHSVVLT